MSTRFLSADYCVKDFLCAVPGDALEVLFFPCTVQAGFPSPAEDYLEQRLDLRALLIKNDIATFFVYAKGHSMNGAGIGDGDLLVVDRSAEVSDGCIAVFVLDGEFTVKRLCKKGNQVLLQPENPAYEPIQVDPEAGVLVWGVVTFIIKKAK